MSAASEFSKLGLLLTVCTAINRDDGYPTFTAHPEEKFLWREAKKLNSDATVLQSVVDLLILDHQILAAMAIGDTGIELPEISVEDKENEPYKVDMKKLKVVVLPNPSDKDSGGLDLGQCTLMRDGVDQWARIKATRDVGLSGPITLSDHVATLSAYLNDYRETDDVSERSNMSSLFSDYITATCWRKMYRRMMHWATLGFIKILAEVPDDSVKLTGGRNLDSTLKDPKLAQRLIELATFPTLLQSVMARYPNKSDEDHLSPLLTACQADPPILYTLKTVRHFHRLLVSTLITYGFMLSRIYDGESKDDVASFSILAHLLSAILNSNALASHLRFLHLNGLLALPTSIGAKGYYMYAAIHGFGFAKTDRHSRKYTDAGGVDKGKNAEMEANMDGDDQTPDGEGEDFAPWTGMTDLPEHLGGWMKTFTNHFSAKRSLERHCSRRETDQVEITLLSFGSQYRNILWDDMKRTIAATIDSMAKDGKPSIPTDELINILECKIRDTQPIDQQSKDVFRMFEQLIYGNSVRCLSSVHCEAALAAFSVYGHSNVPIAEEADRRILKHLIKNLNPDRMAVSVLCCPFCWIFLRLLRGDKDEFRVRGHHSTLYAVDLPGWLPEHLSQDMIAELRGYLGEQLKTMTHSQPTFKKHYLETLTGRDSLRDSSPATSSSWICPWNNARIAAFRNFFGGLSKR